MRVSSSPGAWLAAWWVRSYTRTATESEGADRRAEVLADLHDELLDARNRRLRSGLASRSILGRALRGVPADLVWRLQLERQPGRLEWHLAHPGSLLAALFVLLVPASMVADAARGPAPGLGPVGGTLSALAVLLSAGIVVVAGVALVRRILARSVRLRWGATSVRRAALSAMAVLWAGALLWRFADGPLESLAALSWAGFGLALVVYVLAVTAGLARTVFIDIRKVSS